MKPITEIPLSNGGRTIIDLEDAAIVLRKNQYRYQKSSKVKWHAKKHGQTFYAKANVLLEDGRWSGVYMHRLILGLKPKDRISVDHINGDGLDNRKENLRRCNQSMNIANSRKKKGTSEFKGVSFHKSAGKWRSHITFNYKQINLGLFHSETEAAEAYNKKAKELFGEFAKINDITSAV